MANNIETIRKIYSGLETVRGLYSGSPGTDYETLTENLITSILGVLGLGGYSALANDTTTMAFATQAAVKLTVTGNKTLTTTVPPAGSICNLIVLTSGTNSFTITFGTGFKTTGTLATGTSDAKVFVVSFVSDGTNLYEMSRTTAMTA
jgi:hypothetical protein